MASSNHAAEVQPHSRATAEQPASSDGLSELPGLLQLPPDVLGMVIEMLRGQHRVALFQTCRLLARQVVSSVPRAKLYFQKQTPGSQLDVRRSIITQLLSMVREVYVDITAEGPQPFPHALSDKVRVIWLSSELGDATHSFQWEQLPNVHTVGWSGICSKLELDNLCKAIEQGRLQQLTTFEFGARSTDSDTQTYNRLARALGGQLTHLETNQFALMCLLPQFRNLQSVVLEVYGDASKQLPAVFQSMCNLPGAYVFNLSGVVCGYALKEVGPGNCKKTLRLSKYYRYNWLAGVPLSGFESIEFCDGLSSCDASDLSVLRDILASHDSKVVCTLGYYTEFCLHGADHELLQVLRHAKGVHTLLVDRCLAVALLHTLWAVLPGCVENVQLMHHTGTGWESMWHGVPINVTQVTFFNCDVSTDDMIKVVQSAPRHITELVIRPREDHNKGWRAVDFKQYSQPHLIVSVHALYWE